MTSAAVQGEVIVRPMSEDDLGQVHAIDQVSFSLPWPKRAFRYELLENPKSACWVAELRQPGENQKVIGAIVTWLILDEAHIATLAVLPEYRRLGYAHGLVIRSLIWAVERGARYATLEVRAGNRAAQNLYKGLGFEIVGSRRRYYQDNKEDALIMTLSDLERKTRHMIKSFPGTLTLDKTTGG